MKLAITFALLCACAWAQYTPPSGGGGTPGGANKNLEYNNAGTLGGASGTSWTDATRNLNILDANGNHMFIFTTDPTGDPYCNAVFNIGCDPVRPPSVGTTPGTGSGVIELDGVPGGNTSIVTTGVGGRGGQTILWSGGGGIAPAAATASTGGDGGPLHINGGPGGAADDAANLGINVGGHGADLTFAAGIGGAASHGSSNTGGRGGNITLQPGTGGNGSTANGAIGKIILPTLAGGGDQFVTVDNSGNVGAAVSWNGSLFALAGTLSTTEHLSQPQFQSSGTLWQTNGVGHFVVTTGSAVYTGAGGTLTCYVFGEIGFTSIGDRQIDTSVGTHTLSFIYNTGDVFDIRCNTIDGSNPDELFQDGSDMDVAMIAGNYYKLTYIVSASGASTVTFTSLSVKQDSRVGIDSAGNAQFATLNGVTPLTYDSYGVVTLPVAGPVNQNSFIAGSIIGDGYDPTNISHVVLFGDATLNVQSNGLTGVGWNLTVGAHLCTMMGYSPTCTGDQAFAFGRATASQPGNIVFGDQTDDGGFGDVLIFVNNVSNTVPTATAAHQILFGSRGSTDLYWGDPGGSNIVTFHQGGHAAFTGTSVTACTVKRIEGGIVTDATCP